MRLKKKQQATRNQHNVLLSIGRFKKTDNIHQGFLNSKFLYPIHMASSYSSAGKKGANYHVSYVNYYVRNNYLLDY